MHRRALSIVVTGLAAIVVATGLGAGTAAADEPPAPGTGPEWQATAPGTGPEWQATAPGSGPEWDPANARPGVFDGLDRIVGGLGLFGR